MAPNSRIILTRRDLIRTVPDAPLTPLGKKQAAALARQVPDLQQKADVIISSPLRRTLQTTSIGWASAIDRLGGPKKVVLLPQAQECNNLPCDTGSPRDVLEANPEFAIFELDALTPDWTSKKGFWADDPDALTARAKWVRHYLRDRPERTIVLVAHGDVLRKITATPSGAGTNKWNNAECRIYEFDPAWVDKDECFLHQKENVAVAGGYGPTSTEMDIVD